MRLKRFWMQNKENSFKIEYFEPKYLKKSNSTLDKHLKAVEAHAQTNNLYKQGILKESLWHKIRHLLHLD